MSIKALFVGLQALRWAALTVGASPGGVVVPALRVVMITSVPVYFYDVAERIGD